MRITGCTGERSLEPEADRDDLPDRLKSSPLGLLLRYSEERSQDIIVWVEGEGRTGRRKRVMTGIRVSVVPQSISLGSKKFRYPTTKTGRKF